MIKYTIIILFAIIGNYSVHSDADDVLLMARNNYFEAREDRQVGMEAVSWVVLNRINDFSGRWPRTVEGVVFGGSNSPLGSPLACQFSWTCDGIPDVINDQKAFSEAYRAAYRVYSGEAHLDITEGAVYYARCDLTPAFDVRYNVTYIKQIGKHCFYK